MFFSRIFTFGFALLLFSLWGAELRAQSVGASPGGSVSGHLSTTVPPNQVWVDDDYDSTTPGWGVDRFDRIQIGIEEVGQPGIVHVLAGFYEENLLIDKTIHIVGENPYTTIVDGGANGTVAAVRAHGVEIRGLTLKNSGGIDWNSRASGIEVGIYDDDGSPSNFCTIRQNIIIDNYYGVTLNDSRHAIITNNLFINDGIFIQSDVIHGWTSHIIENNFANGRPIRYYKSETGVTVPQDTAQVILADCHGFVLDGLVMSNVDCGIQIGFSSNCNIVNCHVTNTVEGIGLFNSSWISVAMNSSTFASEIAIHMSTADNSEIRLNTIGNSFFGLILEASEYATIMDNTFLDNGIFVWADLLSDWNTHEITGNEANGKPIRYFKNVSTYMTIPPGTAQVILANCIESHIVGLDSTDLSDVDCGVQLGHCTDCCIIDNHISNNFEGIGLTHCSHIQVFGNTVTESVEDGINTPDLDDSTIACNEVSHNDNEGIRLDVANDYQEESTFNTVAENWVHHNADDGIKLRFSSDNLVTGNVIKSNGDEALHILESSLRNTITRNDISNSPFCVHIKNGSIDNSLTNNNFYDHTYWFLAYDECYYNYWNGNYWSDFIGPPPYIIPPDPPGNSDGNPQYTPWTKLTLIEDPEPDLNIPDNDPTGGAASIIVCGQSLAISKVALRLHVDHSWNGHLVVTLKKEPSGPEVILIDRIGQPVPHDPDGFSSDGLYVLLDDEALESIEDRSFPDGSPVAGRYHPYPGQLSDFAGQDAYGTWTLRVYDVLAGETGTLTKWGLIFYD